MAAEPETVKVSVVHGPNLNLLGTRQPDIYGTRSLSDIDDGLMEVARELGVELESFQANGEGELVDRVQQAAATTDGFLVNAGALTHTSIALLDALVGVGRPYVEVHLSNIAGREEFRRRSVLAASAIGVVSGFGPDSYLLGLRGLVGHMQYRTSGANRAGDSDRHRDDRLQ